jgi:hypothetical protein
MSSANDTARKPTAPIMDITLSEKFLIGVFMILLDYYHWGKGSGDCSKTLRSAMGIGFDQ